MILKCFEYNQHFVAMMNIINLARIENKEGKFERHHIIPRCFFKAMNIDVDNSNSNLVNLTREQHAKVHKLAMMCAKDIVKLQLSVAASIMTHTKCCIGVSPKNKGVKMTSEQIQKLKENHADVSGEKNPFYGRKHSEETRKLISEKISEMVKGEKNPFYGKHHSEETRAKFRAAWTRRRERMNG